MDNLLKRGRRGVFLLGVGLGGGCGDEVFCPVGGYSDDIACGCDFDGSEW